MERTRRLPKLPEDSPVDGSNCLTVCLYNIPRGGMTIVVPATIVLITGLAALGIAVASPTDDGRSRDWPSLTAPVVVSAVGLVWFVIGLAYWTTMWCKHRPLTRSSSDESIGFGSSSSDGIASVRDSSQSVELISVYWLS